MIILERKVRRFDREFRVFNTPGSTYKDLLEDEKMKRPLRGNELYFDDLTADLMRNYESIPDYVRKRQKHAPEQYLQSLDNEYLDKEMDKLYGE